MAELNPRADEMKPILHSEWLPEQIKGAREQGNR